MGNTFLNCQQKVIACAIATTIVMKEALSVLTSLPLLDSLRNDPDTTWSRESGSNIDVLTRDDERPIAICHLDGMQPFTYGDKKAVQMHYEGATAIALAAHHLNVGDGSLVPEVEGLPIRCNIRFTVEFADTEYSPSVAVDHVLNITSRLPGVERKPCAFIGAHRSAISIPTSMLTGLWNYPQVSGGSTSADLDDTDQYPLFGRTVPSDHGNAVPIIQFMHDVLGINHLAVLNVNDAYGNAFVQGLRLAADLLAPDMKIHQVPVDEGMDSIRYALTSIKEMQYKYIFAILFTPEVHDAVLMEAFEMGIAGTGKHTWLFGDSFDKVNGRTMKANSPLNLAYRGVGMLEATGGVDGIGLSGFDEFLNRMAEVNNPTDLDYLFSLFPRHDDTRYQKSIDSFSNFLSPATAVPAPFLYEATIALGLAACSAVDGDLKLDGKEHFNKMVNTVFQGINEYVVFDPITGSKDPTYTLYKVTNYVDQPASEDGMVRFAESVTHLYREGAWEELSPFVFNDGSNKIPSDIPLVILENEVVHVGVRVSVLVLCGMVVILGVGLMAWTHQNRKARVVLASQPFFLHIVCVGAIVMACTIIPLSIDHGLSSLDGCTLACISIPWLGIMGFSMTVSALFTKTHRINMILNNTNRMQRIKVTIWDVAKPMISLLSINTVVLSVMSALAPPKYEMIVMSQDAFGRTNEIRGQCNFEQSYPYIGCVCLVNFAALLFTIAQAVKARNLSMEFAESAQIFRALMAITVVLFVGGPVLLLSRDNANTLLFVASSIIFVANACIMLLLFVPKIKFWMTSKKNKGNRRLHISGLEMSRPTSQNSGPTDSYVEDDDDDKTKEFTGMKILTTKTPEELVGEVEALKRLLRKARPRTEETASSEIDALNWFELPRNPSLKSILKKSSELTLGQSDQMPIEVSGHTDKSEGTTGMINSECSEQGSPQWNMSDEIRDEDSSTITSRCRLESLRDKRDMAKMKFVSLVSRDAKDKADTDPSEEGSTGYSMQHVEDEHLS